MSRMVASLKILVEISQPVYQAVRQHTWSASALLAKPFFFFFSVKDWFVQDREIVREHPALRNVEVRKDRNRNPKELQTQTSAN